MVDSQQLGNEEEDDDEDDELPPYLNTEYLSTAVVPPLSGKRFQSILCFYWKKFFSNSNVN